MNIKEKIGQRIKEERLAKGFTLKNLVELTEDLKQTRISNWERGNRTPGPEEIKQLARALEVSPAYLMCLTDKKHPETIPGLGAIVPLLDHQQASDPKSFINTLKKSHNTSELSFIPVTSELNSRLGEYAFALKVKDDSMHPELRINDILIIDPDSKLRPGCITITKLNDKDEVLIRRYKELSVSTDFTSFELQAENNHWGNIPVTKKSESVSLGVVVCIIRYLS